jgi:hypothetical protein
MLAAAQAMAVGTVMVRAGLCFSRVSITDNMPHRQLVDVCETV